MIAMVLNRIFKVRINSELEDELNKFTNDKSGSAYYNFQSQARLIEGLKLLLPWNKYTYPLISLIVAYYESDSVKWFFKLIFEHIIWNFKKFDPNILPDKTLRKIVKINDTDATLELRKGR
jgi:hypothetical protein